jgi:hypothetical protein
MQRDRLRVVERGRLALIERVIRLGASQVRVPIVGIPFAKTSRPGFRGSGPTFRGTGKATQGTN